MPITYYKRYRMERDLDAPLQPAPLPPDFLWLPWREDLIDRHAEAKFHSFHHELDSIIFPCLGDRQGCLRLMREIRRKPGFLPAATWLISGPHGLAGTIQGVIDSAGLGAIQNVGVVPEARGLGLGRALVRQALHGFAATHVPKVYLEVTAENLPAVALYRSMGFRRARTLYRAVEDHDPPTPWPFLLRSRIHS
jgi:GNAT superfamily N-acetyltransferase